MSADGGWRRLLPAPRKRPNLLAVLVRWRVELLLITLAAALGYLAGITACELMIGALFAIVCAIPSARALAGTLIQTVIAPHRVRSALIQAGVTDRRGSPPWLMWSAPAGSAVRIRVWLRSGTTVADLREAVPIIAAAAGAVRVEVDGNPIRQDRATVVLFRPRWGFLRT